MFCKIGEFIGYNYLGNPILAQTRYDLKRSNKINIPIAYVIRHHFQVFIPTTLKDEDGNRLSYCGDMIVYIDTFQMEVVGRILMDVNNQRYYLEDRSLDNYGNECVYRKIDSFNAITKVDKYVMMRIGRKNPIACNSTEQEKMIDDISNVLYHMFFSNDGKLPPNNYRELTNDDMHDIIKKYGISTLYNLYS